MSARPALRSSSAGSRGSDVSSVRLAGVAKRYGETVAVEPLDLAVTDGEFLTLLGPSGCGKTTTLRMIAGFIAPSAGRISVDDDDITALPPQKRSMGMVFQDYSLFPHLSVEDNIAFGLVERGVAAAERRVRVRELLDLIRLPQIADRYPVELSGGQQQRVFIARALAGEPDLLIMDEPTVGIDQQNVASFYSMLNVLNREHGIAILLVTHEIDLVTDLATHVACLNRTIHFHGKQSDYKMMEDDDVSRWYGHPVRRVHQHRDEVER